MIETLGSREVGVDEQSAHALLTTARSHQALVRAGELGLLETAAQWAVLHPAGLEEGDEAYWHDPNGILDGTSIVATGCPSVREYAVPELGAALGISTTAAKKLIAHAIELQHRLPKTWARVRTGDVDVWRARLVAETTFQVFGDTNTAASQAALRWIDSQIARCLGSVTTARVNRIIDKARLLFALPVEAEEPDPTTRVSIELGTLTDDGTTYLNAELTLADALDVEHALRHGAAEQKALGSTAPLDTRRATALGDLARHQTALTLWQQEHDNSDSEDESAPAPGTLPKARRLNLRVHLNASAVTSTGIQIEPAVELETPATVIATRHVTAWAKDTFTEVRVLPVIDLSQEITNPGYRPGTILERQIKLRDRCCVFPWCENKRVDLDHITAWTSGAPPDTQPGTTSSNLAPLCRSHHRVKTFTSWHHRALAPGIYLWTSPHGLKFLRHPGGTTPL